MTAANVRSEWVGGDLYFYDKSGNEIFRVDGTNGRLTIAAISLLGTVLAATGAELNRVADVSGRIVAATAATLAVDEATHEGKTVVLDRATGVAVTLPAATGGGARYRFVNKTAVSGGTHTFTTTGNDTLRGVIYGDDGDGEPANAWAAGASDEIVTMDGSTQGGAVGDWVEFEDVAADLWAVRGSLTQTGTEATPFSSAA